MPEVHLRSLGRAVPQRAYTQAELYAFNPFERTPLTDRLFLESSIRTRSLFVPPEFFGVERSLGDTNRVWREGAMSLASAAFTDALEGARLAPTQIDLVGVTTVTGYTTPGLDLLLAHAHGLRRDIDRVHFNNIGCHAAVPLLRVVADHVARRPGSVGVAVAVEVCSACFVADTDPQNLVALSLFADGAAAAVLSTEGDGPVLVDFASGFDFEHIAALGFNLSESGFRIVLDPAIPDRIAASVAGVVDGLLARHGLVRDDVALWGLHPGGARVLDAAQRSLALSDEAMAPSRHVLATYGNMSSPSVLFVLAEALERATPPEGSWGVLAAFGPGLGVEAVLLRFGYYASHS